MAEQAQQLPLQDAAPEAAPAPRPSSDVRRPGGESEGDWLRRRREERRTAQVAQKAQDESKPDASKPETDQQTAEISRETDEETQVSSEGADAQTVESEAEAQAADASQTQDDGYFPETLPELAEALGVEFSDFRQGMTVPVKVNGEERTVSLADLAEAYSSKSERDRLGIELAEQRKTFQAESERQTQEWQNRIQEAEAYVGLLQASLDMGPSEQELEKLYREDEFAYNRAVADRHMKREKLQGVLNKRNEMIQRAQNEQQKRFAEYRRQQQEGLLSWKPDLRDTAKMSAYESRARAGLKDHYGFTDDDVSSFFGSFDLRQIKVLDDALSYRELKKQGPAVRQRLAKLPTLQKPGLKRSDAQRANDDVLAARNRLKSSGTTDDAIKLIRARRAQRKQQHDGRKP